MELSDIASMNSSKLMEESITCAAGASHGQMTPAQLQDIAHDAGRVPLQRTTLYGMVGEVSSATVPGNAGAPSLLLHRLH
jgi:hypothetical protein